MRRKWRLAYLVSHPIQYQAPLLRMSCGFTVGASEATSGRVASARRWGIKTEISGMLSLKLMKYLIRPLSK